MTSMINYHQLKTDILDLLNEGLSKRLSYHSILHILDVMKASRALAEAEGLSSDQILLVETAALLHDSGFLYDAKDHEERSCVIAEDYLPRYGYSENQIIQIKGMIMATKIPQSPQNHLEQIVADADLDYLGRDDFFSIGARLYDELFSFGLISNERDWNLLQVQFLENHRYFTTTAINHRSDKKAQNLEQIKLKLTKIP